MKECDEAKGGILCCGQHKMIMDTEPWKIWFTDPEVGEYNACLFGFTNAVDVVLILRKSCYLNII